MKEIEDCTRTLDVSKDEEIASESFRKETVRSGCKASASKAGLHKKKVVAVYGDRWR